MAYEFAGHDSDGLAIYREPADVGHAIPRPAITGTLDFRKPTDTVFVVAYFGTDVAGARYLQEDGTFAKDDTRAKRLPRAEGEAFAASTNLGGGLRLHLWIARRGHD